MAATKKQIIFIDFSTKRTSYNSPNEHIQYYFQILSEYLALQLNLCQSTALDLRKIKQRHYTTDYTCIRYSYGFSRSIWN